MEGSSDAAVWGHRISELRWTLILGQVARHFPASAVVSGACATIGILLLRGFGGEPWITTCVAWGWIPVALVAALLMAIREGLASESASCVRLEESLGLHSQLSAAREGLAPWPAAQAGRQRTALAVRWGRVLPLPALAAVCVSLSTLLPMTRVRPDVVIAGKPPALTSLESLAEALTTEPIHEPEALKELERTVEELAETPPEGWFSHGFLEATESLLERMELGLAQTADALDTAATAVEELSGAEGATGDASAQEAANRLSQALRALEASALPVDAAMRSRLAGAANRTLTAEEARQLASSARAQAGRCRSPGSSRGMLEFQREGETGSSAGSRGAPGSGGIDRGPGTAPVVLAAEESRTGTGGVEMLESLDLKDAQLGETVQQVSGRHSVDRSATVEGPGGRLAREDGTSEVVGIQHLTPRERQSVEAFFR